MSQINNIDSLMRSVFCVHFYPFSPPLTTAHQPIHTHPHTPFTHTPTRPHADTHTHSHNRMHTPPPSLPHPSFPTTHTTPHSRSHANTCKQAHKCHTGAVSQWSFACHQSILPTCEQQRVPVRPKTLIMEHVTHMNEACHTYE